MSFAAAKPLEREQPVLVILESKILSMIRLRIGIMLILGLHLLTEKRE
jgi:hypothetical protein